MEAQLSLMTNDMERIKQVYQKSMKLSSIVADPRTIAVIHHSRGKVSFKPTSVIISLLYSFLVVDVHGGKELDYGIWGIF